MRLVGSETVVERSSRLGLVRRSPAFGLLFLATAGSSFGTYIAAVALTLHITDLTGSPVWVAGLLIADFLPIVVIGLLLGPLVDRLSRRWLMIGSDIARFGVFAVLPFTDSPALIVALAGISGVATGFFRPAAYAGLPNLVPDDELTNANSLLQTIETLAWMIGPVVGALLYTAWGPDVPYVVNALTFLVSIALIAGISERKLRSEESLTRGHWRDVADGLRLVVTSVPLRTVLIVWNVVLLASAAINVAEVFFAKDTLHAGNVGFGVIVAASGVGLALGSYLAAPSLGRAGLRRNYAGSIALMGAGWGLAAFATSIWVAVPFVIAGAAGNGAAIVCNQLLVQRGAPDRFRGRALATIMSSNYAVLGLAMGGAGILTSVFGARWVWMMAGVRLRRRGGRCALHDALAPGRRGRAGAGSRGRRRGRPRASSTQARTGTGRSPSRRRSRSRSLHLLRSSSSPSPTARRRTGSIGSPRSSSRSRSGGSARLGARRSRGAARVEWRIVARREWPLEELTAGVRDGDRRALARAISLVENGDPLAYPLVRELYPETGRASVIGITGPPGVGKSSLIGALVSHLRSLDRTVGVVSVDPSSPFSRGALLGDRIRLTEHFLDPGVFIRSMGSRGHLGGLAETTLQAVLLLDAAGKDVVFVETVGAGQSDVEVTGISDSVLLVLMPGSGDSVQALKAGIMEIPDVIAINKMDHPTAKTMLNEVRSIVRLAEADRRPPIVLTEAVRGENVTELWDELEKHRAALEQDGRLEERRRQNLAAEVFAVASSRAKTHLESAVRSDPELERLLDEVQRRELDPLSAVREIMEKVFRVSPDASRVE